VHRSRLAALLLFGAIALPLWAADGDEADRNARLWAKWSADPEHKERLQRDLRAFWALPRDRQERLRRLDRELHECGPEEQKRLWDTLERYAAWLDSLPEVEREQILSTADKHERLKLIKQKREEQWLKRLPAKDREELEKVPDEGRPAAIAKLRDKERERRLALLQALKLRPDLRPRPSKPTKLDDFPPEVVEFVNDLLVPMLSDTEQQRLKNAEGWPALAQTVLDLSERHPVLPPAPGLGQITKADQMPKDAQRWLRAQKWQGINKADGRWPDYAVSASEYAARRGHTFPRQLGASKPSEFSPEIQDFIKERLLPAITKAEAEHLGSTENKPWPAYPKLLHELAKQYHLVIPGMSLPGPRELWESARAAALPDVPERELQAFAAELTAEERERLNLSPADPALYDRLRQEYFRRHPHELKRLHDLEQKGRPGKGR
jgi:hypothetical protein